MQGLRIAVNLLRMLPPPRPMATFTAQKIRKAISPGRPIPNRLKSPPKVRNCGHSLPIRIRKASEPA
ncbi:hypothetical protein D3C76_1462040 [compost metagenome]